MTDSASRVKEAAAANGWTVMREGDNDILWYYDRDGGSRSLGVTWDPANGHITEATLSGAKWNTTVQSIIAELTRVGRFVQHG